MDGKPLSENWKDYGKFDAVRGVSGRWIDPQRVAIHSPAGWWMLLCLGGVIPFDPAEAFSHMRKTPQPGAKYLHFFNVTDAIRSGNRNAPKFQRFQDLVATL